MSKRKQPFPLEKITINIRAGDAERLRILHPTLGYGPVIARLVIAYLNKVDMGLEEKGLTETEIVG